MNISEAVKVRILDLCSEYDISINKLSSYERRNPINSK